MCILVTLPQKRVDFTCSLHRGLWAAVFNLSMLSRQEVTGAWKTVQNQLVGRGFCPYTVLKSHHSHLGSWGQDAPVCGRTHHKGVKLRVS